MPLSEDPRASAREVEDAVKAYVLEKSAQVFARGTFFELQEEPAELKTKTRYVQCDVLLADLRNTRPPTKTGLRQALANVDSYFQYRICGPPSGPTKKAKVEVYRRDACFLRQCWTLERKRIHYHRRAKDSQTDEAGEDADEDEDEGAEDEGSGDDECDEEAPDAEAGDDQECDEEAPDAEAPDSQETLMLGG